jgi:Zn-dependent protease with chaperone function
VGLKHFFRICVLLAVALALAGCDRYQPVRNPRGDADLLHDLGVAERVGENKLLQNGPILVFALNPQSTGVLALDANPGSEDELGDQLTRATAGIPSIGPIRTQKVDGVRIAVAQWHTAAIRDGRLINAFDSGAIPSSLRADFPGRLYLSINETQPFVLATKAPSKLLDTKRFLKLDGPPVRATLSIPLTTRTWTLALVNGFFGPLYAAFLLLLGWVVTRLVKRDPACRWAYGILIYPLAFAALPISAALAKNSPEVLSLLGFLMPDRTANVMVDSIFSILILSFLGELLLLPPRPGSSEIAAWFRAAYHMRWLWFGYIVGVIIGACFHRGDQQTVMVGLMPQFFGLGMMMLTARERSKPFGDWQAEVDKIAAFFSVAAPTVSVDQGRGSIIKRNAVAMGTGQVVVGGELAKNTSEAEMRFILAHEVAHFQYIKQPRIHTLAPRAQKFQFLYGAVLGLLLAFQGFVLWVLGPILLGVFVYALFQIGPEAAKSRELEKTVDADALSYTGDLDAAISALEKIHVKNRPKGRRWDSHPTIEDRIANLRSRERIFGLIG